MYDLDVYTRQYILSSMKTAKLFKNGQSQAVRLPKEFRFEGESVYIHHLGNYVVLVPKDTPWKSMFEATEQFSEDFLTNRIQGSQLDRESFN